HQVRSRPSPPELSRVRRISLRIGARSEEGPHHEAGVFSPAGRITIEAAVPTMPREEASIASDQLELDDLQHFLLTRTPALAARYEFLSFDGADAGKTWLAGLVDKVGTASSVGTASPDARWVTVALTWNGLRALGVDDAALSTFPEEFRQGFAPRAEMLGGSGASDPEHWEGGLADAACRA